jgi:hypothetical protein
MPDSSLVHRVFPVIDLDHCREERAALEVRPAEPFREYVKYRQQLLARSMTAPRALGFKPILGPELFATAQEIDNQVILGRKIPVQRHLRRAGLRDDGVDSHRPDTFPAEQVVGCPADPFPPAVLPRVLRAARPFPPVSHCHASLSLPERIHEQYTTYLRRGYAPSARVVGANSWNAR